MAGVLWFCLVAVCLGFGPTGCDRPRQQSDANANAPARRAAADLLRQKRIGESGEVAFTVDPGKEEDGFDYYFASFCELGLTTDARCGAIATTPSKEKKDVVGARALDLTQAVRFLGYDDLTAEQLENLPSTSLMSRFPGDVLASAFFAPKITDVSKNLNDVTDPKQVNVGWRKLVRLKARAGSSAQLKGVGSGWLLFNKFQGPQDSDPFRPTNAEGLPSNESKATQLILIRDESSPPKLKRPVYFFVFGPLSEKSKLITFLTATFDARDPSIVPDNKYHVPHACADCHGGKIFNPNDDKSYAKLKLNYLDTDHWFDRLDDDFVAVKEMSHGVLYDGGKDETTAKFADAFNVIRQLNTEIRAQNAKVEPSPTPVPSFQLRAVDKWLELHQTSAAHRDVFARALSNPAGASWDATKTPDKELLPLLNQYCFRCHSSLRYSIFDRPAVVRLGDSIITLLNRPVTDPKRMPQDRNLDCTKKWRDDKQRIHTLTCALNPGAPCPTPTPPDTSPCPAASPSPTP
ncbi:MAG: hypothetical protein JOZ02_12815 [Acidobacteria bacterium]|nr:hypothetical protein [Acidobacteriota bacterium]